MTDIVSEVEFVEEPEGEDEVETIQPDQVSQAVVYSSDWTVQTIVSQLSQKNVDLNPRFQRRDAWGRIRKSRFVESLILGLPVPEVVLAEKKGQRGKYLVIDGKQRLLTLLQFSGEAETSINNNFKLTGLEVRTDLNGKQYRELQGNFFLKDIIDAYENQPIRSVVIRNWPNSDFLHMVFHRLNTGSVSLSPQELRQALFPGEFSNFIDDAASQSNVLKELLKLKEPDFRMRDIELLVRYLGFSCFLNEYAGNLRAFLDLTCERLNKDWDKKQEDIQARVAQFENAIQSAEKIFGKNNVGRKWTSRGFEPRLNRAILDVIAFYFSDDEIREHALENSEDVLEAFKNLCITDFSFVNAVEFTTKSLQAAYNRLAIWGNTLKAVLPIDFAVPTWDADHNRIIFTGF